MSARVFIGRVALRLIDAAGARVFLRQASHVGAGVRVFGRPSVVNLGQLRVGAGAVFMSTPASVTVVVEAGASIEIGEGAVLESGATLRARHSVVIGRGARVGVGCLIDDSAAESGLRVEDGASLEDGAVLLGSVAQPALEGRHVDDGTTCARVRAVVARVVPAVSDLAVDTELRHAGRWDSLAALRVLVSLEKELGVSLPYDIFASPQSLASLSAFIQSELAR